MIGQCIDVINRSIVQLSIIAQEGDYSKVGQHSVCVGTEKLTIIIVGVTDTPGSCVFMTGAVSARFAALSCVTDIICGRRSQGTPNSVM